MRVAFSFLLVLLVSSQTLAFTTKKLETKSRASFKSSSPVPKEDSPSHAPASTPVFAFNHATSKNSPSVLPSTEETDEDDDLVGYGTAVVSCMISLALGYTLGYAT